MLQEDGPNGAMKPTSKESQNGPVRRGWSTNKALHPSCLEVDFRKRYVFLGIESFRSVGIA